MKKWVVYILRCGDGSFYTGVTNDLVKRVDAHNAGKGAKYTRGRLPVEVVWFEEKGSEGEAKSEEFRVKKMSRRGKERLVGE